MLLGGVENHRDAADGACVELWHPRVAHSYVPRIAVEDMVFELFRQSRTGLGATVLAWWL